MEALRKRYQLTLHLRKLKLWSRKHRGRQLGRHLGLEQGFLPLLTLAQDRQIGATKCNLLPWNTRQDFPTHCEFFNCKRTWTTWKPLKASSKTKRVCCRVSCCHANRKPRETTPEVYCLYCEGTSTTSLLERRQHPAIQQAVLQLLHKQEQDSPQKIGSMFGLRRSSLGPVWFDNSMMNYMMVWCHLNFTWNTSNNVYWCSLSFDLISQVPIVSHALHVLRLQQKWAAYGIWQIWLCGVE